MRAYLMAGTAKLCTLLKDLAPGRDFPDAAGKYAKIMRGDSMQPGKISGSS